MQGIQTLLKQIMEKQLLIQNYLLITLTIFFVRWPHKSERKLTKFLNHFKIIYRTHAVILFL